MRRIALTAALLTLLSASAAQASIPPRWVQTRALQSAQRFWAATPPVYPTANLTLKFGPIHSTRGYVVLAESFMWDQSTILFNRAVGWRDSFMRYQFCLTVVHEYGHFVKGPAYGGADSWHSKVKTSVMQAVLPPDFRVSVCRWARQRHQPPVILLGAR